MCLSNASDLLTDSMCRWLQVWQVRAPLQTLSSSCSDREPGWSLRLRLALRLGGGLGWDSASDSDHRGDVAASSGSTSSCLVIRILTHHRIHTPEVYKRKQAAVCHREQSLQTFTMPFPRCSAHQQLFLTCGVP